MRERLDPQDALRPRAERTSDALHERVRSFAERWEKPALYAKSDDDTFEGLALDIARFQLEQSPGFARLVALSGSQLDTVESIPAVPVDAFRLSRVAVHPAELDAAVFRTSGTTAAESGSHALRTLRTLHELELILARRTLFSQISGRALVVALAPPPGHPPQSSLGFMMRGFMEHFDGRALTRDPEGTTFEVDTAARWLVSSSGVDIDGLTRAAKLARARSEPLVVLATSFALAGLLEELDGESLPTPERTFVMVTGGFKGRVREVPAEELLRATARALGTREDRILGEYGMTELSSQLYEAWPGPRPSQRPNQQGQLGATSTLDDGVRWNGRRGVYYPPPWLRVMAVGPNDYRPVPAGEVGLARFIDLANVDSAVAIQTQDLVRIEGEGIELLGRAPRAPARGCSLPFEGLVSGAPRRSP
ncbi:MAG TPA: acyl-protein synthetase [Polyangiaceae bacterium]|nr:acyl-protein synthetase [Polyangiaceae bacterium]